MASIPVPNYSGKVNNVLQATGITIGLSSSVPRTLQKLGQAAQKLRWHGEGSAGFMSILPPSNR